VPVNQIPTYESSEFRKENIAFKTFVSIAAELDLSRNQCCALLGVNKTTYSHWIRQGFKGDRDKLDRMVFFLSTYHLAGTTFPGGGGAKGWLTRSNSHPDLAGHTPLDRMLQGGVDDILTVHRLAQALDIPCS